MKKYIILAASAFCIVAVSNAQASQKQSGINSTNPAMAVNSVAMTKSGHTPATVSAATKAPGQTTIKRKHHHKKTVHPKKMVNKK